MSGHTPGPWVAEPADMFGDHNIVLADNIHDTRAVAAVVSNMRPEDEVAANAAFIVRACNSHDALLEALEELVGEELGGDARVPSMKDETDFYRPVISWATRRRARAAIALAKGTGHEHSGEV